jgi:hypothetical protein
MMSDAREKLRLAPGSVAELRPDSAIGAETRIALAKFSADRGEVIALGDCAWRMPLAITLGGS